MASVRENLIAAKALIDTPEKWLKGKLSDREERCFCAYGAVASVTNYEAGEDIAMVEALRRALPHAFAPNPRGILDIAQFNDLPTTTHADVMAWFDRAIAASPSSSETSEP